MLVKLGPDDIKMKMCLHGVISMKISFKKKMCSWKVIEDKFDNVRVRYIYEYIYEFIFLICNLS